MHESPEVLQTVKQRVLFKRGVLGTGLNGETRFDVVRWVFREASALCMENVTRRSTIS